MPANLHLIGRILPLAILLALSGCSTLAPVEVKSDVQDPSKLKDKSVAVMRDFYMEDVGEADRVAADVREALRRQGFIVKKSELDADLVIIPTLARSEDAYAPPAPVERQILRSPSASQAGMMSDSLFSSGDFEMASATVQPVPKVGLMITAITREEWKKAATTDQEAARVWRVTAITYAPRDSKDDVVAAMLQALEPRLAQIRSGVAPDAVAPRAP